MSLNVEKNRNKIFVLVKKGKRRDEQNKGRFIIKSNINSKKNIDMLRKI
jgi:hypothetical protein